MNVYAVVYQTVELLVNFLYIYGQPVQDLLFNISKNEDKKFTFLDFLWHELRHNFNLIRYKGYTDRHYQQVCENFILLI